MPSALFRSLSCFWLALVLVAPAAGAISLMDQIGPNGSFQEGLSNNSLQISNLYASAPQYDVAVVDDFTLSASASLSTVEAALFAANSATAIASITGLRVNLFDTQPTAATALVGNIFSADIPLAQVALSSPWTTSALTTLATVDLTGRNLVLDAGTYWLSVIAINNSFSTDMGILMSSFAGTPGNDNARQVGSQLWAGSTDKALNADAAYRVSGTVVPEPSTFTLVGAGLALLARRKRVAARSHSTFQPSDVA